jgi:opacity protein-like surface antigen
MRRLTIAAVATFVWLSVPATAHGQNWEASGLVGYTPSVNLDRRSPDLDELDIRGGFTWGVQAARSLTDRWSAEVLWTRQESALEIGTADGTVDLFMMTIRQLAGNAVYHFAAIPARFRPFVFAGLGATFFSADATESETKLSLGLGGGVKYFVTNSVGIRGHFRYKPIWLNDEDAGRFCDPFGFCQNGLQQIEIAVGGVVRF